MNSLQKHESGALEPVRRDVDIQGLFQAAMERGPEVVERIMAVRRELNAEAAKVAFDTSMAGFQDECPPVWKNKGVPTRSGTLAYRFSPFEHILEVVKPCMKKWGFSFTLDTDTASEAGWVIARCKVTHSAGHSEVSSAKFPLGDGTQMMSKTQVYSAALTFASRRVFCNAFGIVTKGEDTDGQFDLKKTRKPGEGRQPMPPLEPTGDPLKSAKKNLWAALTRAGAPEDLLVRQDWLRTKKIIGTGQTLDSLTLDELTEATIKVEIVIQEAAQI
jgi:hypothetical protein